MLRNSKHKHSLLFMTRIIACQLIISICYVSSFHFCSFTSRQNCRHDDHIIKHHNNRYHIEGNQLHNIYSSSIFPSDNRNGFNRRKKDNNKVYTQKPSSSTALSMALIQLQIDDIEQLISVNGKPTPQQYQSYYGRTQIERYNRIVEGCIVALVGCCMSYFLSYVFGSFIATILGTLSLLWGILSPELKAYQRNWEFLGGRKLIEIMNNNNNDNDNDKGLYGALWISIVKDVCVVEDATMNSKQYDITEFNDYTMDNDELDKYTGQPYLIRLLLEDNPIHNNNNNNRKEKQLRELQIHARMSEEYLFITKGMTASILLLSKDSKFRTLDALTDIYLVDTTSSNNNNNNNGYDDNNLENVVMVGDYPYLNRAGLEEFLINEPNIWDMIISSSSSSSKQNNKEKINRQQKQQSSYYDDDDDDDDKIDDEDYSNSNVMVPIRRKKRR